MNLFKETYAVTIITKDNTDEQAGSPKSLGIENEESILGFVSRLKESKTFMFRGSIKQDKNALANAAHYARFDKDYKKNIATDLAAAIIAERYYASQEENTIAFTDNNQDLTAIKESKEYITEAYCKNFGSKNLKVLEEAVDDAYKKTWKTDTPTPANQ